MSEPIIGERERELVDECLRSGWVSSAGIYLDAFEGGWAGYCGRKHGIAVSNGTVALQLAIAALGLAPGDEVIMPTFTIISCATAIIYAGAIPVLVDADPDTWGIDVSGIEERITARTRAIMPVHIYGHPVDLDPILELARRYGLAVVEDAAEAHGAQYETSLDGPKRWQRCGSFGDASTFSFYANKLVTTGEGGMVLTDDDELAWRLRSLRNLAFHPERRFLHETIGYNFRLTNLQAAVGVAQLERIEEIVERKRAIAARYTAGLADLDAIRLPIERPWARNVYWMYGLVSRDPDRSAAWIMRGLHERGVETRPFFLGMHRQPALIRRGLFAGEAYPVADTLADQGLYLPSGPGLPTEQQDRVIDAVRSVLT